MENNKIKAYIAFAAICIIWGTTYLVLKIGVLAFPAFLFSGVRQTIAGIILLGIVMLSGNKIEWKLSHVLKQIYPGIMLVALGNGVVGWAETFIPSGIAALICSMMPVYVVLINLFGEKSLRSNIQISCGVILGFAGMLLIFRDNLADLANPGYLTGTLVTFGAGLSWAIGSIYNKKHNADVNPFFAAALQLFWGGLVMLIVSPFIDDYSSLENIDYSSLWALGYLIIVGSVVAYGAYAYAISELPVSLVSVYAYINPLVALVLGYVILNEKMTWITIAALAVTITGLYLVNYGTQLQRKKELQIN